MAIGNDWEWAMCRSSGKGLYIYLVKTHFLLLSSLWSLAGWFRKSANILVFMEQSHPYYIVGCVFTTRVWPLSEAGSRLCCVYFTVQKFLWCWFSAAEFALEFLCSLKYFLLHSGLNSIRVSWSLWGSRTRTCSGFYLWGKYFKICLGRR